MKISKTIYYLDNSIFYRGRPAPLVRIGNINDEWGQWVWADGEWIKADKNRYIPSVAGLPLINNSLEYIDKEYVDLLTSFD